MKTKLNASFFDKLNVVLVIVLSLYGLKLASFWAMVTVVFFMIHVIFSKKTLIEIKNKMFE